MQRVADAAEGRVEDADVVAAAATFRRAAEVVASALAAGRPEAARSTATDALVPAADALHAAVAEAAALHRASNDSAGLIADVETLFMMVFAALMAGLLFRRFEAARRSGELEVAAAKAHGEARFQALVHHSSDLITLIDADLVIGYQTPSITRLLGYAEDELLGTSLGDLTHPEDRLSLLSAHGDTVTGVRSDTLSSLRLRHRDGNWRHVQSIHTNLLADPDVRAVVVTTRDVTEQKELEARSQHNAFHDAADRAGQPRAVRRPARARPRAHRPLAAPVAVLFVDLDDFKAVNDGARPHRRRRAPRRGRRAAARGRCARATPSPGSAATSSPSCMEDAEESGRAQVRRPPAGRPGRAVRRRRRRRGPRHREHRDRDRRRRGARRRRAAAPCRRRHVRAPRQPARAGRPSSARGWTRAIIGQLRLKTELARAVERDEFTVYYQPMVELENGPTGRRRSAGAVAAPRARAGAAAGLHPAGGADGLIVPIGRLVLREACRQMRRLAPSYPTDPPMTVSVNLSARELDEPGLVDVGARRLAETGLDPPHLVLEITESLLLVDLAGQSHAPRSCGRSACGWPSTTSVPATRRWPTSRTCPSTS